MSWGRLLQMWGPKCEKVRKPGVLRLKRWSLSMRMFTKSGESGKDCKGAVSQKDKRAYISVKIKTYISVEMSLCKTSVLQA